MPKQIESLKSLSLEVAKICKKFHKPTPETELKKRRIKKIIKVLYRATVSKCCAIILEENEKNSRDVEFLIWGIIRAKGIRFSVKIFEELRVRPSLPKLGAKIAKLRREAKRMPGIASLCKNEIKKIQEEKKEIHQERARLLSIVKSTIIDYFTVRIESGKDKVMIRELQKISAF